MSYFFNDSDSRRPLSDNQLLVADSDNTIKVIVAVSNGNELKLGYELNTFVGIDLSGNELHGVIPVGIFCLQGVQYLNLSYNFLCGRFPAFEVMHSSVALDLSHNSLSGQVPDNVSSLHNLTLLNLSYNCFSGLISQQQGYGRFPGAFAGNPKLCVESTGRECGKDSDPAYPVKTFEKK
ncbi:hypothetical protein MLD38_039638 [Melastoma candidum]|uniref:Uncharacterized protein n=1 Tax=Melastoma candidum TaxID=119954 RepID=A0ACB9L537_9MYRT|nr:hypothetical protein MLD38_039638 [Melastoma candidum]